MFQIKSTKRRSINKMERHNEGEIFWGACNTDIDNHADTHCFGQNFRPIFWTSQECTVSPFLAEYSEQVNIPICTAATSYTLPTGEVILLIFGQGLWFGNRMKKSLINPNQCRAFDVPVCDDPTDPHRTLGISANETTFIPMDMEGSSCTFLSRYPTDDEIQTCRRIELSDEFKWDPSKKIFQISSMEEENMPRKLNSRSINLVQGNTPSSPPTVEIQDDIPVHEFDRAMAEISLGLPENIIRSRLISQIQVEKTRNGYATITNDRHHGVQPDLLARKWGIGLDKAKATLKNTTQDSIRSAILPLTRRYRTDLMSQRLRRLSATWYTDTLFSKIKSIEGNNCAQLFTDGEFVHITPMESKSEAGQALNALTRDIGVPNTIIRDGSLEQAGKATEFTKTMKRFNIESRTTEPYTPRQNRAENVIGIIKGKAKRRRVKRNVPRRLWDYGIVWEAEIYSRTAGKDGRPALEKLLGDTIDISEWIDFEFYDLCWYWDNQYDTSEAKVGRWLGVSHRVGSALSYWVLTDKGTVLSRTTVQHFTSDEVLKPAIQEQIREYHVKMSAAIDNHKPTSNLDNLEDFVNDDIPSIDEDDIWEEQYNGLPETPELDDKVDQNDPVHATDTYDKLVGAEVCIPDSKGMKMMAKVVKRIKDNNGTPVGTSHENIFNNHSLYEVKYPDGETAELEYNVIAENMMSQIDSEGHHYQVISEISDHAFDNSAIKKCNGFIRGKNGNLHPKITTRGCKLEVEMKDGSVTWIPLKDLKLSNPVELAEYAVANEIADEPVFKWWVHETLKKRDRIISKIKAKYWRTTHKFGIEVPKTVDEAYAIDHKTNTQFWTNAIAKEMKNVRIAFEKLQGITEQQMRTGKIRPGFNHVGMHMIFDIKMDGQFTRKARLVADGHRTKAPASITYSSVVSRDSVRVALLIASLNGLNISACDIGNAYLNAECREKLWTIAGSEFGSEKGSIMLIVRALYGLKSSGAAWRAKLAETLDSLGYKPTEGDPDVWIKRAVKPCGEEYYAYMLTYVDDVLHIHFDPSLDMKRLNNIYRLKDGVGSPKRYLGANIDKVQLQDGRTSWSMSCTDYLRGAVKNVDEMLKEDNAALKSFGDGHRPYPSTYRPEIDVSELLNDEMISRYQQLIGILRWSIELGRIDIQTEVSCLSQHLCAPRIGHLNAAYKIFRYLSKNMKNNPGRIVFDSFLSHTDERIFDGTARSQEEWNDFYPDAVEVLPRKIPEPLGNPVVMRCYVDANHAGNLLNRRSHSGIIIYINNAPIVWYSKRQNTVESSSFGSEFVALRIATEMIEALRYKLRTFGIRLEGPTEVFCDNKSVVTNSSVPSSVLNKRHNAICYHRVREAQASNTLRVGWIPGDMNVADLLTKTTMTANLKHALVNQIFHNDVTVIDDDQIIGISNQENDMGL